MTCGGGAAHEKEHEAAAAVPQAAQRPWKAPMGSGAKRAPAARRVMFRLSPPLNLAILCSDFYMMSFQECRVL